MNDWIDFEEEYPLKSGTYLVDGYIDYDMLEFIFTAYWDGGDWSLTCDVDDKFKDDNNFTVTHWQPLPKYFWKG